MHVERLVVSIKLSLATPRLPLISEGGAEVISPRCQQENFYKCKLPNLSHKSIQYQCLVVISKASFPKKKQANNPDIVALNMLTWSVSSSELTGMSGMLPNN